MRRRDGFHGPMLEAPTAPQWETIDVAKRLNDWPDRDWLARRFERFGAPS